MNGTQSGMSTGKALIIVVLVAIVAAVVVTFLQDLLFGKTNIAVTGGVVGGVTAAVILVTMKKKAD
jgi:hypothetical protein